MKRHIQQTLGQAFKLGRRGGRRRAKIASFGSLNPQQIAGNQAIQASFRQQQSQQDRGYCANFSGVMADYTRHTAGTNNFLARSALTGLPSYRLPSPNSGKPVDVYDTPVARQAADQMGAFAFAYRDSIFLGHDPNIPNAPSREEALRHEMVHVLQSRQKGPLANRGALERQAQARQGNERLLTASAEEAYGILWIPFIIAGGYILLKPNTANAPGPKDKVFKSMDLNDYAKMVAEAAVLASGGAVVSGLRKAGYSTITTWGVSGAYGSMSFRGVQDVFAGSFSGIDAYVVDGLTGATIGVVVGGTFHAIGKVPGISRARNWFMRGSQNDPAWAKLSPKNKLLSEIGQKTLANADEYAKIAHLSPLEKGARFVKEQGWLRALFPNSAKFLPGTGGTFPTGPTPGGRWLIRAMTGYISGILGNALFGDSVREAYGTGMESYGSSSSAAVQEAQSQNTLESNMPPNSASPPTIIVVSQGKELEYYLKTGQLGDFPVPDGTSGLYDYPEETQDTGLDTKTVMETAMG